MEKLQVAVMENMSRDLTVTKVAPKFTFGNGEQKAALSTVGAPVYVADQVTEIEIAVIDANVPILLGMDSLRDRANSIIGCGRGWIALPDLSDRIFKCERLPGGHLAVCLTEPQWWASHIIVPWMPALET